LHKRAILKQATNEAQNKSYKSRTAKSEDSDDDQLIEKINHNNFKK